MKTVIACCWLFPAGLAAQSFDCYIQSAEARMDQRKDLQVADKKIRLFDANGPNPHKLTGGQLYDLIGAVFIPGATIERLIAMLQDYDHRPQYFPENISASKLLCASGGNHFQYSMRLKEPAILDVASDVMWERVSPQRWRCRSASTRVAEVGKDHGYLRRVNSYWRFWETSHGVFVESETITLSDEFSSVTRMLGSAIGISPERSLRHSLASMRESVLKADFQMPNPPPDTPQCGDPVPAGVCPAASGK